MIVWFEQQIRPKRWKFKLNYESGADIRCKYTSIGNIYAMLLFILCVRTLGGDRRIESNSKLMALQRTTHCWPMCACADVPADELPREYECPNRMRAHVEKKSHKCPLSKAAIIELNYWLQWPSLLSNIGAAVAEYIVGFGFVFYFFFRRSLCGFPFAAIFAQKKNTSNETHKLTSLNLSSTCRCCSGRSTYRSPLSCTYRLSRKCVLPTKRCTKMAINCSRRVSTCDDRVISAHTHTQN